MRCNQDHFLADSRNCSRDLYCALRLALISALFSRRQAIIFARYSGSVAYCVRLQALVLARVFARYSGSVAYLSLRAALRSSAGSACFSGVVSEDVERVWKRRCVVGKQRAKRVLVWEGWMWVEQRWKRNMMATFLSGGYKRRQRWAIGVATGE